MNSKRVFISYAHRDAAALDAFRAVAEPLLAGHDVVLWCDHELRAGDIFHQRLEYEAAISDVVVFLVSEAFMGSEYCQKVELVWALERANALDVRVVPVILEDCAWQETVLRHFNATPPYGRPVRDFPSESEGFRLAAQSIVEALNEATSYKWAGPAAGLLGGVVGAQALDSERSSIADIGGALGRAAEHAMDFAEFLDHDGDHDGHHSSDGDHHTDTHHLEQSDDTHGDDTTDDHR